MISALFFNRLMYSVIFFRIRFQVQHLNVLCVKYPIVYNTFEGVSIKFNQFNYCKEDKLPHLGLKIILFRISFT